MSEATCEVIYRETVGAGDDNEHSQFSGGIVTTLSYWYANEWRTSNHYLLESKVMVDRELVVDDVRIFRSFVSNHSKYIRMAISEFDQQLKELNPDVAVQS